MISLFSLINCSTHQKKTDPREKMFPDGIYSQNISVEINIENRRKESFPFRSITKVENLHFETIGLSPFGTKVFEAQGEINKMNSIKVIFHIDKPLFAKEVFIKKAINSVNKIHTLKKEDFTAINGIDTFSDDEFKLEIHSYNSEGLPKSLRLITTQWSAYIELLSYQPNKK